MKPTQREERRGASILLLSIVFMVILLLLSTTLFQIIPAEMHAANRSHENLNAHMVARAGITDALKWLEFKMGEFETSNNESDLPDFNSGTVASPVYPNIQAYETAVQAKRPFAGNGDWRYECEIVPQQDTKRFATSLSEARPSRTTVRFDGWTFWSNRTASLSMLSCRKNGTRTR